MWSIGGTRFTTDTYNENLAWRKRKKYEGCIYGVMQPLSETIHTDSFVIVFEMINDTNSIAGIGIIKNSIDIKRYIPIYDNRNYNNYIYESKYRIDATDFNNEEKIIILIMEILLFTGSTHLKRGQGITTMSISFIAKAKKSFGDPESWTKIKKESIVNIIKKIYNNDDKTKIIEIIHKFIKQLTLENLIDRIKLMFETRSIHLPQR